jgi:hypothetical protein
MLVVCGQLSLHGLTLMQALVRVLLSKCDIDNGPGEQCRLGRRPSPTEAIPCELLACGITIISDAATLAADPDTLKKVCDGIRSSQLCYIAQLIHSESTAVRVCRWCKRENASCMPGDIPCLYITLI